MALSTTEEEYISSRDTSKEAIWLQKLLYDLFDSISEPVVIHYDNQSCIKISENHVFHDHSKHMEMRYHYVHDMVQRRVVSLQCIMTDEKTMDVLTKTLSKTKFEYF